MPQPNVPLPSMMLEKDERVLTRAECEALGPTFTLPEVFDILWNRPVMDVEFVNSVFGCVATFTVKGATTVEIMRIAEAIRGVLKRP